MMLAILPTTIFATLIFCDDNLVPQDFLFFSRTIPIKNLVPGMVTVLSIGCSLWVDYYSLLSSSSVDKETANLIFSLPLLWRKSIFALWVIIASNLSNSSKDQSISCAKLSDELSSPDEIWMDTLFMWFTQWLIDNIDLNDQYR